MLKWPGREEVERSLRVWAEAERRRHPELLALGYFGSYARGEWGVGSDLDLVAIVREAPEPFDRRSLAWSLESLSVPAELLVYQESEWDALQRRGGRFAKALSTETVWILQKEPAQGKDA